MNRFFLKIYEYMDTHRKVCLISFLCLTICLTVLTFRLNFKEDISAFLPLEGRHKESMQVYQDIAGASKLIGIFQYRDTLNGDPTKIVEAIGDFEEILASCDTAGSVKEVMTEFDMETVTDMTDFAYSAIPYFLTEEDYARIDSLLENPDYIANRLDEDKQLLMMPASGLLSANLQKDPLNLFSPTVTRLQRKESGSMDIYDGRMFTPDMQRAVVLMESPYGNSETQHNAELMQMLNMVADSVMASNPEITLHYIGGPAIAVGNADRIKRDSVISIVIAIVLISLLLVSVFRSGRNLTLIVISVSWGMLFALAMLSVVHSDVSLIVVGISSIILGIAVNYPLHLIAHLDHTPSMKETLREIIAPLVVGNVTTVGAFLALVPLKATALRDLGIFSAFILIGTILFTVVYLPHVARRPKREKKSMLMRWLERVSDVKLERRRGIVVAVCLLTCVFAYFSTLTGFDSDMSHINFMTDEQHEDMEYFSLLTSGVGSDTKSIYVVSEGNTLEDALNNSIATKGRLSALTSGNMSATLSSPHDFLPSAALQEERIARWNEFLGKHKEQLGAIFDKEAQRAGFSRDAFDEFNNIIDGEYAIRELQYFEPLSKIWKGNVSQDSTIGIYRAIDEIRIPANQLHKIRKEIEKVLTPKQFCFDVQSMNSAMANGLSNNFNYIGWACGLIVFFFLWFSFSSIELALLSFLPMAVSWIWIMGIMGMTGIQFNIVNIILATFIFGQGDDYTIFITEGCCYEYACRRKMLASYKSSIIISALIMFIGIGTLIFAKHPALKSLAEVTIVGMFSVVLMAWMLPPLVFRWITMSDGHYRLRPLTLPSVIRAWFCGAFSLIQLIACFIFRLILFGIFGKKKRACETYHRFATWIQRMNVKILPGVKFTMTNPDNETLRQAAVIVCNHRSMLDFMYMMAWSRKIVIVTNEGSGVNAMMKLMFKCFGIYNVKHPDFSVWKESSLHKDIDTFKRLVTDGYSIAFLTGNRRVSEPQKWLDGACYVAQQLGLEIVPVVMHGVDRIMPNDCFACYSGSVEMHIDKRISPTSDLWSEDYADMTRRVHAYMEGKYLEVCRHVERAEYYVPLVLDRYRYKGVDIWHEVKASLGNKNIISATNATQPNVIILEETGYGERALLMALVHKHAIVKAIITDSFRREVAHYACKGVADNIIIISEE